MAGRDGAGPHPASAQRGEVPGTRQSLRHMLADLGERYLVVRLGVGDPDHAGPPHTPRLPADQVVEIVDDSRAD